MERYSENREFEYAGPIVRGEYMLVVNLIVLPLLGWLLLDPAMEGNIPACVGMGLLILIFGVLLSGYFTQEPNTARVLIFLGKYKGTCRQVGFYWILPFYTVRKMSLRIRNTDIDPIKVNDKAGNPVLIGIVLVWKIVDTYKAVFDVEVSSGRDSYNHFVSIQSDSALRDVTGHFPYDSSDEDELSLRSSVDEISQLLQDKINERVAMAGIGIVEARINYLAYAPEIAAVMLKRQQAAAVISAREKIVEGAVSMVQLALDRIEKDNVAKFSESQRAQTVSNLMMVLCSDEPVTPVINAGE